MRKFLLEQFFVEKGQMKSSKIELLFNFIGK